MAIWKATGGSDGRLVAVAGLVRHYFLQGETKPWLKLRDASLLDELNAFYTHFERENIDLHGPP